MALNLIIHFNFYTDTTENESTLLLATLNNST